MKKTIDQLDVRSKRVLMRVDFNVPLTADGQVANDRRIRLALPTIRSVLDRGGQLVLMSHCGRPAGRGYEPALSLRPVAGRLSELLGGSPVGFPGNDCIGAEAGSAVDNLADGCPLLLENLRFHSGEKSGDETFAGALAAYGDVYCNDAFGTAHRDDASMVAVPAAMAGKPRVAGRLLQRELTFLVDLLERPQRPFVALLGGAKVSDKLAAIGNLIGRVDQVLIGGAMAYTFLHAQGREIGASLLEADMAEQARAILGRAADSATEIVLPVDHVCGRRLEAGTPIEQFTGDIGADWSGFDIGPDTVAIFTRILEQARTIIWNGPMGVFETTPFDAGTRRVAAALADATTRGAVTVVGGGDSAAAIEAFGLQDKVSHVSTGGGASLQLLEGRRFRSVALLDEAADAPVTAS